MKAGWSGMAAEPVEKAHMKTGYAYILTKKYEG